MVGQEAVGRLNALSEPIGSPRADDRPWKHHVVSGVSFAIEPFRVEMSQAALDAERRYGRA